MLAGQHLPVCRCYRAVFNAKHDDRNIAFGRHFPAEQRRGHFAAARLQNLKYAAFAFGAAAVVYNFKFFTLILTEKYIIMLHCVDELAGNVYN